MNSSLRKFVSKLRGKQCWYVSCGGSAGASFFLALGGKIKREWPLKNSAHPPEFRNNDPEFGLLVWSSWRLSKGTRVLATSDAWDEKPNFAARLRSLKGLSLSQVAPQSEFGDLQLSFSDGRRLDIFCDRLVARASAENNWELFKGPARLGGV